MDTAGAPPGMLVIRTRANTSCQRALRSLAGPVGSGSLRSSGTMAAHSVAEALKSKLQVQVPGASGLHHWYGACGSITASVLTSGVGDLRSESFTATSLSVGSSSWTLPFATTAIRHCSSCTGPMAAPMTYQSLKSKNTPPFMNALVVRRTDALVNRMLSFDCMRSMPSTRGVAWGSSPTWFAYSKP